MSDQRTYPPVSPLVAGVTCRCPRCGKGKLFDGFLSLPPRCNVCGLDYSFIDAGDGPAVFIMFFAGFVGELVGGQIADMWRQRGGQPNQIFRTLFGIAAIVATVSIFSVAYVTDAVVVVALLSSTLFFLRWCGMYWAIPSILATRDRAGFLGGCMNLGGNIAGITVPIIVGFIVQFTGSYFLALMFFAGAGVALLICSTAIDYSRKLPV